MAGVDHDEVVHRLDAQAQDAAHHEYPEDVEEVEGDVAFAGFVAPERAILGGLARLHVAQLAAQLALLGKRWVQVALHHDEEHGHDAVGDQAPAQAGQHDVAQHHAHKHGDHGVGDLRGVAALVAQQADAEHGEHGGQYRGEHGFRDEDDEGGR